MLAYYRFRPGLLKTAGFGNYLKWELKNAGNYLRNNKFNSAMLGLGILGGGYLGNEAYKAAIPNVKVLPRLEQAGAMPPQIQY